MIKWNVGTQPAKEGKYLVTVRNKAGRKFVHIGYHDSVTWTGYILSEWEVVAWSELPMPFPFVTDEADMLANTYQSLAARTINKNLKNEETLMHALHGLAGEVGEIHSIFQKKYQGHVVDREHLIKEMGDLLWFIAELCTAIGCDMESVMKSNIKKLKERYPEGFEEDKSLHRKEGDI